jgi:hypothetical protein
VRRYSGASVVRLSRGVNENGVAGAGEGQRRGADHRECEAPRPGTEDRCRGRGSVAGKGEESCDGWPCCGSGLRGMAMRVRRAGVCPPAAARGVNGEWRLPFGGHHLLWRYAAIYAIQNIHPTVVICPAGTHMLPWTRLMMPTRTRRGVMELPPAAPAPVVTEHAGVVRDLFDNRASLVLFSTTGPD